MDIVIYIVALIAAVPILRYITIIVIACVPIPPERLRVILALIAMQRRASILPNTPDVQWPAIPDGTQHRRRRKRRHRRGDRPKELPP